MTIQTISPLELQQRLAKPDSAPLLLDVREPHEYAYCHLPGSLHIPMQQVPGRLAELDRQRETVVICHHGMRSAQVAQYLIHHGFAKILNLKGGIHAWAAQVDTQMPAY